MTDSYTLAQELLATGRWAIDYDRGVILGVKRKPFVRLNSWGYIQIKFRRPDDWRKECAVVAHRVIWESVHGPLASGLEVNHLNGIKTDNRLANLDAVTPSVNMSHAYANGLNHATLPNARLSPEQALEIYRRCRAGERDTPLAVEYGMKRSAISNIRNGWSWNQVTHHR